MISSNFTPAAPKWQRQGKNTTGLAISGHHPTELRRDGCWVPCVAVATCLLKSYPGWDGLNVSFFTRVRQEDFVSFSTILGVMNLFNINSKGWNGLKRINRY